MTHVDNFLRNVESRYPQLYEMLNGDRARREFEDRNREMEHLRKLANRQRTRVVALVTDTRVVRTEKIGARYSRNGHHGWMLEVPVVIVRERNRK